MDIKLAGLDFRQVEDVVDQVQQVAAALVDDPRRLDLVLVEVALLVAHQRARQDQQAVERRAQLVRHVGKELGFVARRLRQVPGGLLELLALAQQQVALFLQLLVAGLQLFALRLELLFRLTQQLGLFLQLLVGLAQLFLLLGQARRLPAGFLEQQLGVAP